ncbi:rab-3A-interacting protein, partial [Caerostris extrusa]
MANNDSFIDKEKLSPNRENDKNLEECNIGIPFYNNEGKEVFEEADNCSDQTISEIIHQPCTTFQVPSLSDANAKNSSSMKIDNSPENVARASTMRTKIEEKITEIEKKMDQSTFDSSSESLDMELSPADYNLIKVLDPKRSRSCSVSEMRQSTIDRLQSKLEKAEKDLELREEEVLRLRKIRDEVGSEIEDLTASLFEVTNNMVRNAQVKQHKAEKKCKGGKHE